MFKPKRSKFEHSVVVLNQYEIYVSNHTKSIFVAAHDIYEACDKVYKLISSWETSESHEIVSVSLSLCPILC